MNKLITNDMLWTEIAKRIEAGEKQAVIARELGLTPRQVRYRLHKFNEQHGSSKREVATTTAVNQEPNLTSAGIVARQGYPEVDPLKHTDKMALHETEQMEPIAPLGQVDRVEDSTLSLGVSQPSDPLFDESWTRQWGMSRLVLLVKDPTSVFAYWEVDDLKKSLISRHFQCDWANLSFFLELYDVTDIIFDGYNAHTTTRIAVHPHADNWYIHDVRPGRHYLVAFGTITLQGRFFAILRSNVTESPPSKSQRHFNGIIPFAPVKKFVDVIRIQPGYRVENAHGNHSSLHQNRLVLTKQAETGDKRIQLSSEVALPYPSDFDGYRVRPREGN